MRRPGWQYSPAWSQMQEWTLTFRDNAPGQGDILSHSRAARDELESAKDNQDAPASENDRWGL